MSTNFNPLPLQHLHHIDVGLTYEPLLLSDTATVQVLRSGRYLDLLMPTPTTENHQLYIGSRSILENDQHTNQIHHASRPESFHVSHVQTSHNLELRNQSSTQLALPTTAHGTLMMSASWSIGDPGQDVSHWTDYLSVFPTRSEWTAPSGRQSPLLLDDQPANESSSDLFPVCSSDGMHFHYPSPAANENIMGSFVSHHSPYQSFLPLSPHFSPHTVPPEFFGTGPRSNPVVYRVPLRNSLPRRHVSRAIAYEGIWIDEEELLQGLREPDGKIILHQCRWEEGHSSCHLWVKVDKSSINTHIQKWHGGRPGGDKLQADCRWSACGKTMLKESVARYIVSIHLEEMLECQGCGKKIARNDALGRHAAKSNFEVCRTSGALITYSHHAREVDARAALNSGGSVRYAST